MTGNTVLALVLVALAAGWAIGRTGQRIIVVVVRDDDDGDGPDIGFPVRTDPEMARLN